MSLSQGPLKCKKGRMMRTFPPTIHPQHQHYHYLDRIHLIFLLLVLLLVLVN
jgi:hypothetical protein